MRRKKNVLLAILITLSMMFSSLTSTTPLSVFAQDKQQETSTSIYVSSLGNDANTGTKEAPYASLATAIENAQNGSTIYILDDVEIADTIILDKNITIIGETETNGRKPVLKLSDNNMYSSLFELQSYTTITITDIAFSGKNIDNRNSDDSTGTAFYGGAILIDKDNVNLTVNDCDFSDFEAHQGGAICALTANNVNVSLNNSVFTDNIADIVVAQWP